MTQKELIWNCVLCLILQILVTFLILLGIFDHNVVQSLKESIFVTVVTTFAGLIVLKKIFNR